MLKRVCDRCHRDITKDDDVFTLTIDRPGKSGEMMGRGFDLCGECTMDFKSWFRNSKICV